MKTASRQWFDLRIMIVSAAAFSMILAPTWLQPVLMPEILKVKGMTESFAGLVLTAEMLAMAGSSILYARILKHVPFLRILIIAVLVTIAGNLLSLVAVRYDALLASRVLCGLGEGALLMIGSAAPARLPRPDRRYAEINIIGILVGVMLIYVAPNMGRLTGGPMTFPTLIALFALLFPLVFLAPRGESLVMDRQEEVADTGASLSRPVIMITLSGYIFSAASGTVWPLLYILGQRAQLAPETLQSTTMIAVLLAIVGSLLVTAIGARLGRLIPIAGGMLALTLAGFYLSRTLNPTIFSGAMMLYMVALYFLLPYYYGSAAAEDHSGRGAATLGGALLAAQATSPYLGGAIVEHLGYEALGPILVVANLIGFGLIAAIRPQAAASAENPVTD